MLYMTIRHLQWFWIVWFWQGIYQIFFFVLGVTMIVLSYWEVFGNMKSEHSI